MKSIIHRLRTFFKIIALMFVITFSACGGKQDAVTVPEGAQAGQLLNRESCKYEINDMAIPADWR